MRILRRTVSLLGAAFLIGALAAPVSAYTGEVPANITVTHSGAVKCNTAIPLSAVVDGPSGTGIPGVVVTWSVTNAPAGSHDSLGSGTTTTGTTGTATNTLTLSCVVGTRTVTATAQGGVLGSISVRLGSSGLPNTSTVPDAPPAQLPLGAVLLGLLAAVAVGVTLGTRRSRA